MVREALRYPLACGARRGLGMRLVGRTGASFIIALAFALLVALIATITLTAASVNAERTAAANRADDQAYYAVVSALDTAADLVERDLCATGADAFEVAIGTDKKASASLGTDKLGLKAWARDQVAAIVGGGKSQPKYVVVTASDMGQIDVPDVLVTFTLNENGVFVRSCVDVWGAGEVPADDAVLKADLVDRAAYANYLSKQVASSTTLSGPLPLTVSWAVMDDSAAAGGEGGA